MRVRTVTAITALFALAACGGGDDGPIVTPAPTPTPTPTPTPSPSPTPSPVPGTRAPFTLPVAHPYPLEPSPAPTPPTQPDIPSQPYFKVTNLGAEPANRQLGGSSGLYRQYPGDRGWNENVTSLEGVGVIYDPARDTYGVFEQGYTRVLTFGPETQRLDTAEARVRAWSRPDASEYALMVGKVGPGTPLSHQRYATWGYFGVWDSPAAIDSRYWFVAGSPTLPLDMPQAGAVTFTTSRLDETGYVDHGRYQLTGTATLSIDFAARTGTLRIHPAVTNPANMPGALPGELVIPCQLQLVAGMDITCTNLPVANGVPLVKAYGRFYGPDAEEFGLGFTVAGPNYSYFIHGMALGWRPDP